MYFLRIFKIAKDIKYVVQGEKNGERDSLKLRKVPSQTSQCSVKEKERPLTTSPLVLGKSLFTHFFSPWSGWLHLQTLVSAVCSDISWSHALAPFHSAKGENRYLLAADSREQAERTERKLEDGDTAVAWWLAGLMHQLWITLFFFFFASHPPNRCLSVIVMSWSYPSKWFAPCNWVTHVAIEPLHSSKSLMCAQRRALWLDCTLAGAGRGWLGGWGTPRKECRKGSRSQRGQWNVKVTLFCLEN